MGTTRSYACATQAGLIQLGSNVRPTSRVVLLVRTRRATLVSLHPWRGALTRRHALERCPQKPVTIPRSQLCSRNARRKLYQHVGHFVGSVVSPLLANIVLNHLDWRLEALGYRFVRYADDFVVVCTTKRQAEKALQAVTACVEEDLGWMLNPKKTQLITFGQGFDFLGYHVTARTIRMGGKAEERFKMKIKALTRRSHNLDAEVVRQVNRVIRGTVRYFATAFTTCVGQFNELDRWIRMRIRCMKYKRIWKTDNRRLKSRHIQRRGFVLCREVYRSAR